MDGRDGVNSELQAGEILWVGRAGLDPYWDRCRDRFDLADFDSVYEAVAEVLTGRNACALVLNATFLGTEVKSIVKTILAQNLFSCVCLYSTVPNFPAIAANGDARLLPVADPDDLVDRLSRVLQHAPEISKEEAPRAPAPVAESPKLPPPQPAESPEPKPRASLEDITMLEQWEQE